MSSEGTGKALLMGMPSLHIADGALRAGVDRLILDLEHGFPTGIDLFPYVAVCRTHRARCLVRIPASRSSEIGGMIDQGVSGIVLSLVREIREVKDAHAETSFPPKGKRSLNPFVAGAEIPGDDAKLEDAAKDVEFWIMAETFELLTSFQDEDELMSWSTLTGLTGLIVGPYDLDMSLQSADSNYHTSVETAVSLFIQAATRLKWRSAIFVADSLGDQRWHNLGLRPTDFLIGYDRDLWYQACQSRITQAIEMPDP